tara:strand:+ start:719 stop:880 length:162 start_codon:yes stop_codon:yes gene_type:complete
MKNFISTIFVVFLISCGGGGGSSVAGSNSGSSSSGAAPTGNFAGQVDPVQATD